jgi:hypothetical protein
MCVTVHSVLDTIKLTVSKDDFSPPNSKDLEHSPMADEPDVGEIYTVPEILLNSQQNAEFGPFTDSSAVDLGES